MKNAYLNFALIICLVCLLSSCKKEECLSCQLIVPSLEQTPTFPKVFPEICGSDEELNAKEEEYNEDEAIDQLDADGIYYYFGCTRTEK